MKKQDLLKEVAEAAGVPVDGVDRMFAALSQSVARRVKAGESVKVPGLCMVTAKSYRARPGRNPKTGEPVEVPAALRVRIKTVKAFDDVFEAAV